MANEVVGIEIAIEVQRMRDQLASIPTTVDKELKAAVAMANKNLNRLEKKAAEAGAATRRGMRQASVGAEAFAKSANETGDRAAQLGGSLDLISPALADAVQGFADMVDIADVSAATMAGLGMSMGTLALAVSAVAVEAALIIGIYQGWNDEADLAVRLTDAVATANAKLKPILEDTAAASIDLRIARGDLTKAEGEALKQSTKSLADWQSATEETRKTVSELGRDSNSIFTQIVDKVESVVPAWTPLGLAIDGLTTSSSEYGQEIEALQGQLISSVEVLRENVDTHTELRTAVARSSAAAEGHKRALDAEKEAAEASRKAMEAYLDGLAERAQTYADALAEIGAEQAAWSEKTLDAYGKEVSEFEASRAKILEAEGAALAASGGNLAAEEEARRQSRQAIEEIEQVHQDRLSEIQSEAVQKRMEEEEKAQTFALGLASDSLGVLAQIGGDVASQQEAIVAELQASMEANSDTMTAREKAAAQLRIDQAKKNALLAFRIQQAASIAQAGVTTALMAINAYNDGLAAGGPAGLVLGPVAAGVATAAGVASIAAIASESPPSFHSGGPIDLAPDEVQIKARSKEYMLNPTGRALLGDQTLNQANAGIAPSGGGGGSILAVSVYKHNRWTDKVKKDAIYAGDPYAREINGLKKVGRKSR